jgi:hypothetical protein
MAVMTDIECSLPRPDIAELSDQIKTEFSERLLGGAPVLPLSSEDILAFVMAGAVNLMFGAVTQALKENDPASMCCDNLVLYGAKRGLNIQAAKRAKGYVRITGTPNAPIPPTLRFVGDSSREYKLDPAVTSNPTMLDASGAASVRVVGTTAGAVFDLPAGAALTVTTTLPGIDMDAAVVGNGIIGGTDTETCDALRARVVAAESAGVISTNEEWYLQQAASYPGVTRVCTDECEGCCDPTFVSIFPFMETVFGDRDTAPYGVPPCDVLDEMTVWMFGEDQGRGQGLAPMGIRGRFETAYPTFLDVVGKCASGCEGMDDQILEALREFVRANYCVGSTICKDELRAVAYGAVGRPSCFSELQLTFDDSLRHEDAANAYLACAHFLVVRSVTTTPDQ